MIRITRIAMTVVLLVLAAILGLTSRALAHENRNDDDRDFAWAVIREDENHWHLLDRDRIEELKRQYKGDFFYFRDETGRYVVTDPKLVDEAGEAPREIEKHKDVVHSLADAEARLAMANVGNAEDLERLRRRERELRKEIEEREEAGKSTEALEDKLFSTAMQRKALQGIAHDNKLTPEEEATLVRQRDNAKDRLVEVERTIENKVRSVAETAKRRGLAKRVDP